MKTAKQLISSACATAGITQAELGKRLGFSSAAFSHRIKTGKFSNEEWNAIAEALGATAQLTITFPDGNMVC